MKDRTHAEVKTDGTYFVFRVEGTHFIVEVENCVSYLPVLIWFLITGIVLLLTATATVYREKANKKSKPYHNAEKSTPKIS